MKLRTWTVRGLYRSSSLTNAARGLARYKLNLLGVQEDMWDKGGTVSVEDFNFFMEKEANNINREQEFVYTTE